MQFFKQFLNKASAPTTITDGMVWFKTDLKLNLIAVGDKVNIDRDVQQKKTLHTESEQKQLPEVLSTADSDKLFAEYRMRNATPCVSKGTIYGIASEWDLMVYSHSYYGMNKAVLDSNGSPNPAAVIKHLREINTSIDLKEPRLNKLFNYAVAEDFYDNATSLLVTLLVKYYTLEFDSRQNVSDHTKVLSREQVTAITTAPVDQQASKFANALRTGLDGVGVGAHEVALETKVPELRQWLADSQDNEYRLKLKVWSMYGYDDGHSTSGSHFGDHFGFVNGKFMRPYKFDWLQHNAEHIHPEKPGLADSDALIEALGAWKGHLNLTNMTEDEVMIIDWALKGNKRRTPFLIDQDIDLGVRGETIRAVYTGRLGGMNKKITAKMIMSIYNKMVKSHRWYEESLAAKNLLKYWVCQPATETVESHWWTYVPRKMVLPALGLKRAIFQCFLDGEAVSLTATALDDYKDATSTMHSDMLAPSMLSNTAWYWGEFMARNNAMDVYDLHRRLLQDDDTSIRADLRADAMMSAILGTGVRKALFPGTCTYIPFGLSNHFGIHVRFGTVNLTEVREYGYENNRNHLIVHKLVAPSGVAMITGLPGTLQNSTPYGTVFSTNPMVKKYDNGNWRDAMNVNDVWAHGTVARWNGYDLEYNHPKHNGRHTIYAANDVKVAMPPVPPTEDSNPESYLLRGVFTRKYGFGSSFQWVMDRCLTFRWARTQTYMLDSPEWRSPPAYVHDIPALLGIRMTSSPLSASEYVNAMICKFEPQTGGFHIDWAQVGVVLPQTRGPSELLDQEALKAGRDVERPDPPERVNQPPEVVNPPT
uniref:Putative capsid protein n=1 Tax=Puccinia striiformis totivirus 3 TaxID=2045191 RepID=A0A2D1PCW0_9VIRU|nr:putative capsid protein [Puccinia striiformis totivirus 3]